MDLALIPQPQKLEIKDGAFAIPRSGTIGIPDGSYASVAEALATVFKRHRPAVAVKGAADSLTVVANEKIRPGGYRLKIQPKGVELLAPSVEGALAGVKTLRQIADQSEPGRLPALTINDWPDFPDRGVYYDVCRGRVPELDRLEHLATTLGAYKINQLQLYVEHTFQFRRHPDIGKGASPLSPQDVLALDAVCRAAGVELLPSLASFGHMSNVLKYPQYHDLAEDYGRGEYVDEEAKGRMHVQKGWTLSPANPKVYDFLDELYAEYLPLFVSGRFNVCCDETWDLGAGQSHALCKRKGRGRVYLDHIRKLNDLCAKYGRRMLFWGDIIRNYPELIPEIPSNAVVLDWGYNHDRDFEAIKDFKKAGLDFYACPGTNSWVSLFPRLPEAMENIAGFAAAGKKHGARGLLNTDWGDGGHFNFMELSWHGYLFGAEQAWNTRADRSTFTRRFCKLFMGIDDATFADALDELGKVAQLRFGRYYQSIWTHLFFAAPDDPVMNHAEPDGASVQNENGKVVYTRMTLDSQVGKKARKTLAKVRETFISAGKRRGPDPHKVLPYWLFALETIDCAAEKLEKLGPGGTGSAADRKRLKRRMRQLRNRFEKLWMQRNRRSEIRITLKKYDRAIEGL